MDTITAISTPLGYGGIGIIRISGQESIAIINRIFKSKRDIKDHEIIFGKIYDGIEVIDEVLVSYFKCPYSYTGEDTIEINSHGGIVVMKRILDLVLRNGARMAEPGEFTKRAFLNGKIDLSQAESVMDVINSKSIKQNKISVEQLEGNLGKKINKIKGELYNILVDLEANVDYPEYDIEEVSRNSVKNVVELAISKLEDLSSSFYNGNIIKNGINVAIVGKPNVGKSSLLNRLLDKERAIVSDIPGTTRDTIEESIIIDGIVFNFIDTAGIHKTEDIVEKIGVDKSIEFIDKADVIISMFDLSQELDEEDNELFNTIKDKKKIIIANKSDLADFNLNKIQEKYHVKSEEIISMSTKEEKGIDDLKDRLIKLFELNLIDQNDENIITNERHKEAIDKTIVSLRNVQKANNDNIPLDMISIDLQNAIKYLGEITGESVSEEIINGIFKKFCLGK